jgi:hypothetical protein
MKYRFEVEGPVLTILFAPIAFVTLIIMILIATVMKLFIPVDKHPWWDYDFTFIKH